MPTTLALLPGEIGERRYPLCAEHESPAWGLLGRSRSSERN
jgi:hypothetical protein